MHPEIAAPAHPAGLAMQLPMMVLYVATLCPAGHLPHTGGDWLVADAAPADHPTRGGDVRQDRGRREGMLTHTGFDLHRLRSNFGLCAVAGNTPC